MIGIIEARFYMKDDKFPMAYIKYYENGVEKTLHAPSVRFKENLNTEVSDFVKKIVNQYNDKNKVGHSEYHINADREVSDLVLRKEGSA